VKQGDAIFNNPGGEPQMAVVPPEFEDAVSEAADECPGECIFIVKD
jgi:ferredoxin